MKWIMKQIRHYYVFHYASETGFHWKRPQTYKHIDVPLQHLLIVLCWGCLYPCWMYRQSPNAWLIGGAISFGMLFAIAHFRSFQIDRTRYVKVQAKTKTQDQGVAPYYFAKRRVIECFEIDYDEKRLQAVYERQKLEEQTLNLKLTKPMKRL